MLSFACKQMFLNIYVIYIIYILFLTNISHCRRLCTTTKIFVGNTQFLLQLILALAYNFELSYVIEQLYCDGYQQQQPVNNYTI